jgi:hypothetical protein
VDARDRIRPQLGRCSVTGGYVYRGTKIPELIGGYVFGDYCSGEIWVISAGASTGPKTRLLDTDLTISSFGETGMTSPCSTGGRRLQDRQG